MAKVVASLRSTPAMGLGEALQAYGALGFAHAEVFSAGMRSYANIEADPAPYVALAARYGFSYPVLHLPPITEDLDASLAQAVRGARFAQGLGARVAVFSATSRDLYLEAAEPFLNAVSGLDVLPALGNHAESPISTLEECRAVIAGIDDRRMHTVLDLGQFARAGVHWREAYRLLKPGLALVRLQDMVGQDPVPFGTGDIDFRGFFAQLQADSYSGDLVIEMSTPNTDRDTTLRWLGEARTLIDTLWQYAA